MHARFTGMTLQTLLQQHGITTIKELMHRTGLSRQHCWSLWHGYDGVGKATAKRLHERLGIPAEQLLQVDPVPGRPRRPAAKARPQPKRRPRKAETRPAPPAKEPRPDRFGWAEGDITITKPGEEDA
jgi:transcriptional regulator with XRE-family HTH domain